MKIKTEKEILQDHWENLTDRKWVPLDELIVWLQDTFGNADNVNLIVAELARLKDE